MNIHYSAITECGNPINLNVISDTLHLFNPVGISEINNKGISIYPQPASEKIVFSFDEQVNELQITNNIGKIVFVVSNPESGYQFEVNNYPDGIYFVSAKSNTKKYNSKFIICK